MTPPCWRNYKNNTQLFLPVKVKMFFCEEATADVNMNMLCVETGSTLLQMDTAE